MGVIFSVLCQLFDMNKLYGIYNKVKEGLRHPEECRRAEEAQRLAEEDARVAMEESHVALQAKAEAERRLREGIQPVIIPTAAELEDAKHKFGYQEGLHHFAVVGIAGSGKSSLINALRGLRNGEAGAAVTGITATTVQFARFPDPDPAEHPFVWYDIPGAGTLNAPDWLYFHNQGLFVFDAFVVLVDNRFTKTDIAILRNARLFKIPCFIVRSKADVHIRNIMDDRGCEIDDEEDGAGVEDREKFEEQCRDFFVKETRQNVQQNLRDADLPEQCVYIVSKTEMLSVIKGNASLTNSKKAKKFIDEYELWPAESAREQTQAALKAIAELERQRREGFQPVIMPTSAELEVAKRRIGYQDGFYHFAVAGMAGSGKSSMVNALRGLRNNQKGAAATGITETTLHISRLPDPNPGRPFVWYDIPGAGTLQIEDWQYFHKQGLYVFDALIVLIDNRFTTTDIAILRNARLFKIPCYIVRSKADIHIRNIMHDSGYESDDEEYDFGDLEKLEEQARDFFITKTRENVQQSLRDAGLPEQRIYIVSKSEMLSVIKGNVPPVNSKKAKKFIDEEEFLSASEEDADRRRGGGAAAR
ncbi:P-loop containing nucleoside triphosphate hydrolase protein [Favolaschia claudopus]|uniref:P-loop containing nucleoside triphosphate hydrolase protein n=1 Tax=Favolaschia claudopus TaxID=2862362 RepID=A0AAW0AK24_9AGAR